MWASITMMAVAVAGGIWEPGIEREVDEGTYMRLVSQHEGWRVWRVETKDHVACKAVKPAVDRKAPIPGGVSSLMYGDTPFLEISQDAKLPKFNYQWFAAHYQSMQIQYRRPNDKFWEKVGYEGFNGDNIAEDLIEINISSWQYPAINRGHVEEKGFFDFVGLNWAKDQIQACPKY